MNGDINVTGKTTLSGIVNTSGELLSPTDIVLDVNGKTKLTGDVEVVGVLKGPTNFFIKPLVNGDQSPTVTIEGDLIAVGLTYLSGNTTVTGSITLVAQNVPQSLVSSYDDIVVLDVTGKTKLTGNVEVVGKTNLTGDVEVIGKTNLTGDVEVVGKLKGPNQFIIDPSPFEHTDGTVIIKGNLTVQGNTTTVNSSNLDVVDKNITIAKGNLIASEANNAGLSIDITSSTQATLLYEYNESGTKDNFIFNKQIRYPGDPVNNDDLARKSYVNNGEHINSNSIGLNSLKGFKFKVISEDTPVSSGNIVSYADIIPVPGEPSIFYILNKQNPVTVFSKMVKTGLSMLVYDGNEWFVE